MTEGMKDLFAYYDTVGANPNKNAHLNASILKAEKLSAEGKLVAVNVNGQLHTELIKRGFMCHHLDGQVVHLEKPIAPKVDVGISY